MWGWLGPHQEGFAPACSFKSPGAPLALPTNRAALTSAMSVLPQVHEELQGVGTGDKVQENSDGWGRARREGRNSEDTESSLLPAKARVCAGQA